MAKKVFQNKQYIDNEKKKKTHSKVHAFQPYVNNKHRQTLFMENLLDSTQI
jgi:hypothetical protein